MKNNSEKAVEVFNEGGVVIFPTDTAVGIGCRIDSVEGIKRIYEIRKRPAEKPLLILVSSLEMALDYMGDVSDKAKKCMEKYWPGGVTFVVQANLERVPSVVRAGGETVAIRLPQHNELVQIIGKVGVPIVAPSANVSEERTPLSIDEVDEKLEQQVDFVLPGMCTIKGVSTILNTVHTPFQIMREGVVTIDDEDLIP